MSLKNKIEKTMFVEGYEDRIQDIATLMDISVEIVKKRLKTLTFSDYINVMTALKTQDKDKIERIMGWPARDPNWKSPIDDIDESAYYGSDLSSVRKMKYKDTVKVTDIQWDADDMDDIKHALKVGDLRRDMIVPIPTDLDDEEVDEYISDFITDKTGWTHKGFNIDESSMADTLATAKNADINDFHFYSDSSDIAKAHTRKHTLSRIDTEKYQERDGLEGPIMTKSGKVVYYDPKEGSYYDPDTDIYLSHEEWKELSEAYSTGSQGPDEEGEDAYVDEPEEEPTGTTGSVDASALGKIKTARIQAMQRLGRDNLGGATAAQAADAMDKAEQGKPLTPIQRQAMAYQAANLDALAGSQDTRIQFRNLLNRLRKAQQQAQQEQQ